MRIGSSVITASTIAMASCETAGRMLGRLLHDMLLLTHLDTAG